MGLFFGFFSACLGWVFCGFFKIFLLYITYFDKKSSYALPYHLFLESALALQPLGSKGPEYLRA